MSYFLWIEDFESSAKTTASNLFGGLVDEQSFSDNTRQLKKNLKEHGVFIELSFQDGLGFVRNNLNKIDYIILDIDLPALSKGDQINDDVLQFLKNFHDYKKLDDESEDELLLGKKCEELKKLAGYHIYSELVIELGFPKQHILFCSNHGENLKSIQEAFRTAKITLPTIYKKSDPEAHTWVEKNHENPYSRLRRGIIEGCQYAKKIVNNKLYFNSYVNKDNPIDPYDMENYLDILESFLPLDVPKKKVDLYKLFVRTLSHEWDAAKYIRFDKDKNDAMLAWIMRNTRHWITHNSNLFNDLDEKLVAYLFIINMRVMLNFEDDSLQSFENILLSLFTENVQTKQDFKIKYDNELIPISDAYLDLRSLVLEQKNNKMDIEDAFYFNELANNIQQSKSYLRNDKKLFVKLIYQMFWLTLSNPYPGKGDRRNLLKIQFSRFDYLAKPYINEIARHIYSSSFSKE